MSIYHNFIGIDIGKFSFVVSIYGHKYTTEYENSPQGIIQFFQENSDILHNSLTVVETTGGYELQLIYSLNSKGYKVHRADTRKVKNFIRSFSNAVKTDRLDAKALANYAYERSDKLELFRPQSKQAIQLFQLLQRRNDLNYMLVAEKNRLQSPAAEMVGDAIKKMICFIQEQLKEVTDTIQELIAADPILRKKQELLKTIPGIGNIVSFELLILLPELGRLCRKQIASLAGVAPRANESGKFIGYRMTGHGRYGVKRILFLAAMSARNSKNSKLREFYERLIKKGKKKKVALTAVMRKLIIMSNARIKDYLSEEEMLVGR